MVFKAYWIKKKKRQDFFETAEETRRLDKIT